MTFFLNSSAILFLYQQLGLKSKKIAALTALKVPYVTVLLWKYDHVKRIFFLIFYPWIRGKQILKTSAKNHKDSLLHLDNKFSFWSSSPYQLYSSENDFKNHYHMLKQSSQALSTDNITKRSHKSIWKTANI